MSDIIEGREGLASRARNTAKRIFRHENVALVIVLFALIGIFSIVTKGLNLSRANAMNTLLQSATRGVAAIGQTFVILTAGIDLSVAGVGLFSAILGSFLMTNRMDDNIIGFVLFPGALFVMLIAGSGWGVLNGLLVSRAGVPALIATLGIWQIGYGASFDLSFGRSISGLPEPLAFLGQGHISVVPVPARLRSMSKQARLLWLSPARAELAAN